MTSSYSRQVRIAAAAGLIGAGTSVYGWSSGMSLWSILGTASIGVVIAFVAAATRTWKWNPSFLVIAGAGFYTATRTNYGTHSLIYFGCVFSVGGLLWARSERRRVAEQRQDRATADRTRNSKDERSSRG